MSSKKLINSVDRCVDEALEGLVYVNPGLQVLQGHRVVVRSDVQDVVKAGKVTLLCGGGSGHEPAHAGYIGSGMLSAAVAGAVFTSPPPSSILAALRSITKPGAAGSLIIVKNYTGDRLNFGLAAERAKAEGLKVNMVVVGEDCALTSADKTAGRRGLCGTIFMHKICGALAEEGKPLEEIHQVASNAAKNMGTIGVSLTPCSLPGAGPSFELKSDEMELGLGIHGEAGVKRTKLVSAKEVVTMMLDHMTNPQTSTHINLKKGDKVACMINNLGGTSVLEMSIIAREAIQQLEARGVAVERAYCGSLMTSLDMAGVSITLLHLDDTIRRCLDAKTTAPAWPVPLLPKGKSTRENPGVMPYSQKDVADKSSGAVKVPKETADMLYDMIKLSMERLIASEDELNKLDKESGDGDCGTTLARGAKGILEILGSKDNPGLPVQVPADLALSLARVVENSMGGSSGALYSLFLTSASLCLQSSVGPADWVKALVNGNNTIMRYGGAEPGDRTMVDSLVAAGTTLSEKISSTSPVQALEAAVQAAEKAAQATAGMKARAGRASYVSAERLNSPDPGAVSVTYWMKAVLEVLRAV
ncbi:triokinase/FMN cyclase-like [Ostrea edulis]|uniref:triokinase/FMN cyclase-like n=1 Tax=Ostrea edulis TaxID=37623 RepID=UPI0024AF9695|nr:triokinase/FMN cyclase-like [Ostrea edulis]